MDDDTANAQDARVEALWATLDTGKKGHLDLNGLKNGLHKMGHPLSTADQLIRETMKAVDTNKDGKITFNEFSAFVKETESQLKELFKAIDRDRNGKLDKAELQAAFLRAGLAVPQAKLDQFFAEVDTNRDGVITFDEWRDFLLFIPETAPDLSQILSYFSSTVKLSPEGDVVISDETIQGLGYYLAGALAGAASRTSTAPLDRLKVYLIAQTGVVEETFQAAKSGAPLRAVRHAWYPLVEATRDLWRAGGIRSLFAGNGLNVVKVMPESAVKFGAFEASKRILARIEGHNDPSKVSQGNKFTAGGVAGMISQFVVYPLDTLKFRMQCETTSDGPHGNKLIIDTAKKMWRTGGFRSFYIGLPMGLIGIFPYAAIDLGTFEWTKRQLTLRAARKRGVREDQAELGNVTTAAIGGFSGALGASLVYPINLLRTRLQTQGTVGHPRTYTGIGDVARQTIKGEGVRGLFKGLTPNLLKVVPAVSITYVVYENCKKVMALQ